MEDINTLEVEEAEVEEEEKPAVPTLEEARQIDGLKFKKIKKIFRWTYQLVVYCGCLPPLSVQQPLVLCNLHLKTGLNVQEYFVVLALLFNVSAQAHQLLLQLRHLHLEAVEHRGVPSFCVC